MAVWFQGANLIGGRRRLARVKAALELQLLSKFSQDGFAGQKEALALASGLNASMRVSLPAGCRKENVRVKDNARDLLHDSCGRSSTKVSRWASVIASQSNPRVATKKTLPPLGRAINFSQIERFMISEKALRKYVNQSKPFDIHLADGRRVRVPHGEHISVEPGGRMFLMWLPDGGFELFNLTMVTSIKTGSEKSSRGKN